MTLENVKGLIDHARTAPAEEANMALDLARATIRQSKLDSMATLIEAASEEQHTLESLRGALAYAIGTGKSTPAAQRLHALLVTKPKFDPHAGIRAATPSFEWAQKHQTELSRLIAAI
jgi:hypothetical protein